jgi:hypothetical protein
MDDQRNAGSHLFSIGWFSITWTNGSIFPIPFSVCPQSFSLLLEILLDVLKRLTPSQRLPLDVREVSDHPSETLQNWCKVTMTLVI